MTSTSIQTAIAQAQPAADAITPGQGQIVPASYSEADPQAMEDLQVALVTDGQRQSIVADEHFSVTIEGQALDISLALANQLPSPDHKVFLLFIGDDVTCLPCDHCT